MYAASSVAVLHVSPGVPESSPCQHFICTKWNESCTRSASPGTERPCNTLFIIIEILSGQDGDFDWARVPNIHGTNYSCPPGASFTDVCMLLLLFPDLESQEGKGRCPPKRRRSAHTNVSMCMRKTPLSTTESPYAVRKSIFSFGIYYVCKQKVVSR